MNALDVAKRELNILTVNLRRGVLDVREDVDERTLSQDHSDTRQQGYHSPGGVTENQLRLNDGSLCWEYRFEYKVGARILSADELDEQASDDEVRPLLSVQAVFVAVYVAREAVDKEAIEAFSDQNVGYHVWPYWREFVQSASSRMGMGPIIQVPHYILESQSESASQGG